MDLKLNIGSGQRRFEGDWINIDGVSRPGQVPDLLCDVGRDPLPYPDGTMDVIVLSHIVEHFGCGEATGMMRECYRVLKKGGSVIATVPNIKALAKRWIDGEIGEFIFAINTMGPYAGYDTDRHKWLYSQEGFLAYLESTSSWSEVKRFDWRTIPGMDLARDWWIADAECVK